MARVGVSNLATGSDVCWSPVTTVSGPTVRPVRVLRGRGGRWGAEMLRTAAAGSKTCTQEPERRNLLLWPRERTFLFIKLTHAVLTTAAAREPESPEEIQSEISLRMKDNSARSEKENISSLLI